jgi:(hydroxyamino)benzene mutase
MVATRIDSSQRALFLHGFVLMFIALASGLAIPHYANIRTGLAAHVIGITSGLLLMGLASAWPLLNLSMRLRTTAFWLLVLSLYIGFVGQVLGAIYGLSRMFPATAPGAPQGNAALETIVEIMTKGITPTTLVAIAIVIYGLRGSRR